MTSVRSVFVLIATCALAACRSAPRAPVVAPRPQAVTAPAATSISREVPVGRITLVFETHATSNLLYQLDCLAQLMPCSSQAFHGLWRTIGFSGADDAAIDEWKRLRERFGGELKTYDAESPAFPVQYFAGKELEDRQRWAAFEARSIDDFARLAALVVDVGDAERLAAIARRFEPRFTRWWNAEAATSTVAFVDESAKLAGSAELARAVNDAARFFEADLPVGMRIPMHVVHRPAIGRPSTNAQMIESHGAVEMVAGEKPASRLGVVMHELMHFLYSRLPLARRAAMVQAFADRSEPHGLAAYSLLNEALATAIGNGVIDAMLRPTENAKDRRTPLALYNDARIDDAARSLLSSDAGPSMEQLLRSTTVASPELVDRYVRGTAPMFRTLRPIDTLRLLAVSFDSEFRDARMALERASQAHDTMSFSPLGTRIAQLLRDAPRQTVALFVAPTKLAELGDLVPAATLARLRRTAKSHPSFVDATPRGPGSYLYVFVASDAAHARTLVERFAALPQVADGLVVP